jgi:GTP-binding protein Era
MTTRCGLIAILGAPNAGKSTLVNRLAGSKVTIVSPKPQTTRFRVRAVVMRGESQLVLVDTPGIFTPRRRLDRAMVAAAWGGAQDADISLLIVDARAGLTEPLRAIIERLSKTRRPIWLVLNKTDLIPRERLLPLTAELHQLLPFAETFMISAEKGEGLDLLLDRLAQTMPPGPFLFPEDDLTDLPNRMLAAEIVREQILRQTHQEVPHHASVETETWTEKPDGSVRIDCTIYIARATQKAILIGDKGSRIREIGRLARLELIKLLERPVHLFLNVKEKPDWDETAARIRAEGMDKMADVYSRGPTRLVFEEKDPRGFKEFQAQLTEHSTEGSALTMQGVQRERPSLFDLEAGFKQMKVPTLVIAGDEDDPTLEPSLFLKRSIMSSALLVMPKCGHTMNLEDPDAFNRALLDFVTQVDCGRWTQRIPESLSGAIIAAKEK